MLADDSVFTNNFKAIRIFLAFARKRLENDDSFANFYDICSTILPFKCKIHEMIDSGNNLETLIYLEKSREIAIGSAYLRLILVDGCNL